MMKIGACMTKKPWVRIIGWASVATGAVAVGIYVGRNLRARYLLNHRTPYDFYSHAGDNGSNVEYGVGIYRTQINLRKRARIPPSPFSLC